MKRLFARIFYKNMLDVGLFIYDIMPLDFIDQLHLELHTYAYTQ